MGVSGSGKSTVGALLARELAVPFFDADDFHPAVNIAKMRAGNPLTDKDRLPWLQSLHTLLKNHQADGAVLACSALKEHYREILAGPMQINWVHLHGDFELIYNRMQDRPHFMPVELLQSQFDILEPLKQGLTLDIMVDAQGLVDQILANFKSDSKAQWGIVGMGVMGKSLALNAVSKAIPTAVYNRNSELEADVIPNLLANHPDPNLSGFTSWEPFFKQLSVPRTLLLMVPAGAVVDQVINDMKPYLKVGDCIIDGGNSNYKDTERRSNELAQAGIGFVGMGVSGGEEGALKGPALMPGGDLNAYKQAAPLLQKIAAQDPQGQPCVDFIGKGGAGHLVKTVHNGIEYAEMQLIAELYGILQRSDISRDNYGSIFKDWNQNQYRSYLLGIMPAIFSKKEDGQYLLEKVLDVAAHKGTGSWTAITALEHGQDASIIQAALNARYHSAAAWYRTLAPQKPNLPAIKLDLEKLRKGYQAARILNHLQGLRLIKAVSRAHHWQIDLAVVCRIWTNGCIIKSALIEQLYSALKQDPNALNTWCLEKYNSLEAALNYCNTLGLTHKIHLPVFSAALQFGIGIGQAQTTANVIQAQRDFFGAHTYKRTDKPNTENYHTDWNKL